MAITRDSSPKPGAVTVQEFPAFADERRQGTFAEGSAPRQFPQGPSNTRTSASGSPSTKAPTPRRIVTPVAKNAAPPAARAQTQAKPPARPKSAADIIELTKMRERKAAQRGNEAGKTLLALVPPLATGGPTSSGGGGQVASAAATAWQPASDPHPVAAPSARQAPSARPSPRVSRPEPRYAEFADLGLDKPPRPAGMQRLIVSTYRLLGFGILSIIVVVLVGYIATSAFYFVSDSWIQPMVVSPTDERVLQLKSDLAEQASVRDKIAVDLQHTDRFIAAQQDFQAEFVKAVKADLAERKSSLGRVSQLARQYRGERSRIRASNDDFAKASKDTMSKEYEAGLIKRDDMLNGAYQRGQIANSNLSLAERQAEFENRAASLEKESAALEGVLSKKANAGVLSYDVLKIKRDYDTSRLETAKATEERKALQDSLERHDAILNSIRQSPQLRAADRKADVAFVPYANFKDLKVGTPVYACAFEMALCHEAGKVQAILPGEVTSKHPNREKMLRGQMVELALDDADAAEENVLFVGRKPLLF